MRKSIIIIIGSIVLAGCEKASQSIKDTFDPKIDSTVQFKNEYVPVTVPDHYSATVERQIEEAQRLVTTVMEKHTKTHIDTRKEEGKNTDFLTNEEKLKSAEEDLRKLPQYAGKTINVYSVIHFYEDGSIRAMLQHPANPEYIDNYEYKDGRWSDPRPEQISVRDDIQSRLISLDKINFVNVAKAAQVYQGKITQIEGAKPLTTIYISIANRNLRWFPGSISGSRERYSIELNQNGTLKKFERE